jgi:hypothetical protein
MLERKDLIQRALSPLFKARQTERDICGFVLDLRRPTITPPVIWKLYNHKAEFGKVVVFKACQLGNTGTSARGQDLRRGQICEEETGLSIRMRSYLLRSTRKFNSTNSLRHNFRSPLAGLWFQRSKKKS